MMHVARETLNANNELELQAKEKGQLLARNRLCTLYASIGTTVTLFDKHFSLCQVAHVHTLLPRVNAKLCVRTVADGIAH
jgi:hypothetical protein